MSVRCWVLAGPVLSQGKVREVPWKVGEKEHTCQGKCAWRRSGEQVPWQGRLSVETGNGTSLPPVNVLRAPDCILQGCMCGNLTFQANSAWSCGGYRCVWLSYGAKNEKELKEQEEKQREIVSGSHTKQPLYPFNP